MLERAAFEPRPRVRCRNIGHAVICIGCRFCQQHGVAFVELGIVALGIITLGTLIVDFVIFIILRRLIITVLVSEVLKRDTLWLEPTYQ
jgi:hypothetical protein